jgi:hypothetical protein
MTLRLKTHRLKLLFALASLSSCGTSIFKSLDKSDAATDAAIALEKKQPESAIKIILDALGDEYHAVYDDVDAATETSTGTIALAAKMTELIDAGAISNVPNLVSILASAKAQLHGIDPFNIALQIADSATSTTDSSSSTESSDTAAAGGTANAVTSLFPVLPEASLENLHGLDVAMAILQSIGTLKTVPDQYKEALFLTASVALVTKSLDTDGDGKISALESITLSDAAATILLNQIISAGAAAAAGGETSAETTPSASTAQIQALQSKIDAQEGATQEEKLRNFMAQSGK